MNVKAEHFVFWLQGFFEITEGALPVDPETGRRAGPIPLTAAQVDIVRRHLALVFIHEIDPAMGGAAHQQALNDAHGGSAVPSPTKKPPVKVPTSQAAPVLPKELAEIFCLHANGVPQGKCTCPVLCHCRVSGGCPSLFSPAHDGGTFRC